MSDDDSQSSRSMVDLLDDERSESPYSTLAYRNQGQPITLSDCVANGRVDGSRFVQFIMSAMERSRERYVETVKEWDDEDDAIAAAAAAEDAMVLEDDEALPAAKKTRKRDPMTVDAGNGERMPYTTKMSVWYRLYVESPDVQSARFQRTFRKRFRLPFDSFIELLGMVEQSDLFNRWKGTKDAAGRECSSLALLLLAALRYLGRGWTLDDCDEATGVGIETIRIFLHKFIEFGSTTLYDKYVVAPSNGEDASTHSAEYLTAGLNGAIGSTDATHVVCGRLPHSISQQHMGHKMTNTARSYNLTCNHRRRILSSTRGFPARWNDKVIVRYDTFVCGMKRGSMDDMEFWLYEKNSTGAVVKRKYRGAWLLVDNGYHAWSVTIPPSKNAVSEQELKFSKMLESMRKDVECTFGILKGRWRILKTGIRLHGAEACDNVWQTCCALHNMLLEDDGLSDVWTGSMGDHQLIDIPSDVVDDIGTRAAIDYDNSRVGRPGRPETVACDDSDDDNELYDVPSDREPSGGVPNDHEALDALPAVAPPTLLVRRMKFDDLKSRLINHFGIALAKGEVTWPTVR